MKTILVADDSAISRELVREALEEIGYRVIEAADGREALALALESAPDLALVDIRMPVQDGYETIRAMREDPRLAALPILALTAFAMRGDEEKAALAGFDGYLTKPIGIAALRAAVESRIKRS
jgi:two-component system cell cycle response regulator DivK